jgi:hypothetical protein
VSEWSVVWLGVIAISVAVMATLQVALLLMLLKAALMALKSMRELRKEVGPLVEKLHKVADDANRVSGIAVAQAERLDALLTQASERLDRTMATVQDAIVSPIRQGSAMLAALRAFFSAFGRRRDHGRHGRDDEDALFVG